MFQLGFTIFVRCETKFHLRLLFLESERHHQANYPLSRMEDYVDQVVSAKFVSEFDPLQGYWHVPLLPRA